MVESLHLPDTEVGRRTAKAYGDQNIIGWNALFRGFLASSWSYAQEEGYSNHSNSHLTEQDNPEAWSGRTIKWYFDIFLALWKSRCDTQHGVTPEEQQNKNSLRADRAIRRLYEQGKLLSQAEQICFRDPIETILAKPVADKEHWGQQTELFLPGARRRDKQRKDNGLSAITNFFSRRATPLSDRPDGDR
jgi:hypothetical protein